MSLRRKCLLIASLLGLLFAANLWFDSGRSYRNYVVPLGSKKLVCEMEDFSLDVQLTFASDPLSPGLHGYTKTSVSESSPFGRFEIVKIFGQPDSRSVFYSNLVFPVWFLMVPPLALLFFYFPRGPRTAEQGTGDQAPAAVE